MPEKLKALILLCRLPLFSVRKSVTVAHIEEGRVLKDRTSYQICSTNLLPPPSVIKGALAASYISLFPDEIKEKNYDARGEEAVEILNEKLVYVGAKPYNSSLIKNPILLKRVRSLEKRKEKKKEEKIYDAMLRAYVFFNSCLLVYIFKGLNDSKKKQLEKSAWLINQLGDSESLVFVSKVLWKDVEEGSFEGINMYTKLTRELIDEIESSDSKKEFIIEPMLEDPNFSNARGKKGKNSRKRGGKVQLYVLPLIRRIEKEERTLYYLEGRIPAKSNLYINLKKELNEELFIRAEKLRGERT